MGSRLNREAIWFWKPSFSCAPRLLEMRCEQNRSIQLDTHAHLKGPEEVTVGSQSCHKSDPFQFGFLHLSSSRRVSRNGGSVRCNTLRSRPLTSHIVVDKFTHTIPKDIKGGWSKLGSGSFGNVYKGERLG